MGSGKIIAVSFTAILIAVFLCALAGEPADSTSNLREISGRYLGQAPPGGKPTIFAKGFISTSANEHGCAFTPDGREFYFTRIINGQPTIMWTCQTDSGWTTPEKTSFSGQFNDRLPSIAPDGNKLFFQSIRPWPDSAGPKEHHAWFVQRNDAGWGPAEPLPLPLHRTLAGLSVSAGGRLYVGGVLSLELIDGRYANPRDLGPQLKGDYPFIAPDESYLLFCVGRQRDLAVSFRSVDGLWAPPRLLTDEKDTYWIQGFPIISPCGRYLFFTIDHDIYWVDAKKFIGDNFNCPNP